eukprot:TRINITY_DN70248_c0_g1_i1.p1 TRINITY_DN70248_c0_g1~~TRINITY_DN70248_c0_g1_i1.p1  ORF type:complete len:357 (-),score=94.33 TRINITY_DN70248_c0_g1_i1:116-1186(-)
MSDALTPAAKALQTVRSLESGNDIRQMVATSEGGRAFKLLKKREETKNAAEMERQHIENETKKRQFSSIDQKFGGASSAEALEEEFRKQTVGLVSAEEFKAKRLAIDELIQATTQSGKVEKVRLKRKVKSAQLSFDADEDDSNSDEEEEEQPKKKKAFGKDPTAQTSFLFDADREAELVRKRKELTAQYNREQEQAKNEQLEITYSYWDGSGHRRSCIVEKGFTINNFLKKAKEELEKVDFPELRTVGSDSLLYVKEDLIIPHHITFYQLIKDKARGKSGPLFHFDVHEDIRRASDIRIEKDESHAGKIVDKKWYERNKHVFPASRWEIYSKDRTYDTYTIHGDQDLGRKITSLKG